jgi:hypothetical protein
MCVFRLLPAIFLCCLLAACAGKQKLFYVPSSIDASSLESISAAIKDYEGSEGSPVFSGGFIYKCSFAQAYAESAHVLEKVQLHDSGRMKGVDYLEAIGPREELYVVELTAGTRTYFIYFSVWSNDADPKRRIRFGPAYLGKLSPAFGAIVFFKSLVPKVQDRHMRFAAKKGGGFFFVIDNTAFKSAKRRIVIENIILTEANKIGGGKKYVYNIAGSKLDRFVFSLTDTLQLN